MMMAEATSRLSRFHKRKNTVETCFFVESGEDAAFGPGSDRSLLSAPRADVSESARFSPVHTSTNQSSATQTVKLQTLKILVQRCTRANFGPARRAVQVTSVLTAQRARFIDRFIELLDVFQHSEATLFRAVQIVDRFALCIDRTLDKRTFQLTGIAALRLAAKLEETRPTKLNAFLENSVKKKFTKTEILQWELEILRVTDFTLSAPTELDLLFAATEVLELCEEGLRQAAARMARLSLFCLDLRDEFSTVEIAAFSLIYALRALGERPDKPPFEARAQEIILAFALEGHGLLAKLERFFMCIGKLRAKYASSANISSVSLDNKSAN